jgi:hypothetical protein
MDPERLARFRRFLARMDEIDLEDPGVIGKQARDAIDLLADRDHWEAEAIQAADLKLRLDDALASLASMTEVANKAQRSNRKLEREIFGARELLAPRSRLHPDRSLADHIGALIDRMQAAEAEARRYRSRCPVEASDVEAAGLTWGQALDWCEANGFEPCDPDLDTRDGDGLARLRRPGENCGAVFERLDDDGARFAQSAAYSCNSMSKLLSRPAFDILDEMAAIIAISCDEHPDYDHDTATAEGADQ